MFRKVEKANSNAGKQNKLIRSMLIEITNVLYPQLKILESFGRLPETHGRIQEIPDLIEIP